MAMTLLGISGSLTRGGSTRTAIDCALRAAQQRYPEVTTAVLDLRDVALAFCDGRPLHEYTDDTPRAVAMIQAADAYIIGTPIYRGAYTGSLKNLLDHVPVEALMGKVAGLIATGGQRPPLPEHRLRTAPRVDVVQHAPRARQCLRAWSADSRPGGGRCAGAGQSGAARRGRGGHAPAPPGQSDGSTAAEPHGQTTRLSVTVYTTMCQGHMQGRDYWPLDQQPKRRS